VQKVIIGVVTTIGLILGSPSMITAQMPHDTETMPSNSAEQNRSLERIEQSLANKIIVTLVGIGLIGLELWWFLLTQPQSRKVSTQSGIQEITITVDGGYEPSQILVRAGQPVRLNFDRKDPSSCLEEVKFPELHIAQALPLNQVSTIEFTPTQPGDYSFTCGMNMYRGLIKAE
jgi:plastocyanin domain-containing protein